MTFDFDVIIIGSGPAGVSAAFPLVAAGLKVLMVDGGASAVVDPPTMSYFDARRGDATQWEWMIGRDFHALRHTEAVSPKLRVPSHAHVFDGFRSTNQIDAVNFAAFGSLAPGGLSNAWGCGVARLSAQELAAFPVAIADMDAAYAEVAQRVGISGASDDDLSAYFGVDQWADAPIAIDGLNASLLAKYERRLRLRNQTGIRLGRSRVAALSRDRGERSACNLSGNCLWGCTRRSLYSATEDLQALRQYQNFQYLSGFIVENIASDSAGCTVYGRHQGQQSKITARRLVLGAGTLATTRLALSALNIHEAVRLQSSPTAAYMLWLPGRLGMAREPAFGLGQLSYSVAINEQCDGFGSLFAAGGIPMTDFVRFLPFRKGVSIDILGHLLTSCLVGNLFLPGSLSQTTVRLTPEHRLHVAGGFHHEVPAIMRVAERKLRSFFLRLGAIVLPSSFKVGTPGADIHYSASLPMRADPGPAETNAHGMLAGLENVHIADGASLSMLSAKSHTLTIMANAARIGKLVAAAMHDRASG